MLTTADTAAAAFDRLVQIIARLRAPDGCPWDQEQTPQSAVPYLLEESFEAAEAIDRNEHPAMCEELGDVLLQVVFQSQMVHDTGGEFSITDVANAISDKMIARHPHVFGDVVAETSAEVLQNWEAIKAKEKPKRTSMLEGIPKGLPALLQAMRLGQKASRVGFDWPDVQGVQDKLQEELGELAQAQEAAESTTRVEEELGDVLFTLCQFARKLEIDPEGALRRANQRFVERFQNMEKTVAGTHDALRELSVEQWEELWEQAKQRVSGA